ncbi:MAG: hypothetical protein ABIS68_06110 [Casimicrobiaceae bacterium]
MNTRRWLLVVLALCARAASAQSASELLAAINVYRSASQSCDGARTAAAGTLTANTALAGQSIESGDRLLDRLKVHGYRAASAQLIMVSGLTSAGDVMKFIEPRYCRPLTNPLYTEIGVRRDADRWQIVLARPLLSADLRDWREAGQEILRLTNAA